MGTGGSKRFFSAGDYARYVELVADGCREAGCEVSAWCLMPNHVHLILVPRDADGLCNALSGAHQRYTWVVNRRNGWQGHLWQSRFYSCPLDDAHLRQGIRYVELKPQRAHMVTTPAEWRCSSAAGRVTGRGDDLTSSRTPACIADIADWPAFLAEGICEDDLVRIRLLHRSGKRAGWRRADQTYSVVCGATLPLVL